MKNIDVEVHMVYSGSSKWFFVAMLFVWFRGVEAWYRLMVGEDTAEQDRNYLLPEIPKQEVYLLSRVMGNLF